MSDKITSFEDYKNKAVTPEPVSQDTMNIEIEDPYQIEDLYRAEDLYVETDPYQIGDLYLEADQYQVEEPDSEDDSSIFVPIDSLKSIFSLLYLKFMNNSLFLLLTN